MNRNEGLIGFFVVMVVVLGTLYILSSFLNPRGANGYRYLDGTVVHVWGHTNANSNGSGNGHYKVRLSTGYIVEALSFNKRAFERLECVRVQETVGFFNSTNEYEIEGPTDDCWQPL